MVGVIEDVSLITQLQDDALWNDPVQLAEAVVRICHISGEELRVRHD